MRPSMTDRTFRRQTHWMQGMIASGAMFGGGAWWECPRHDSGVLGRTAPQLCKNTMFRNLSVGRIRTGLSDAIRTARRSNLVVREP